MLKQRWKGPEKLDDLTVHGAELDRVLEELARINRWGSTRRRVLRRIRSLGLPDRPRIVDIGCGAGDLLASIRADHPDADLIGVDGNPAVLESAATRVDATFVRADVMDPGFSIAECDLAVSTHFLYHFADDELRRFVDRQPARAWVIAELRRSRSAELLFQTFGPLALSRWTVDDGMIAIRRAFTVPELRTLLGPDWSVERGVFEMVGWRGPIDAGIAR